MNRGFSPPDSKFFRDVLHFFKLHPQDIRPSSISNICNFQVFCEVYLQEETTIEIFRQYFYLNRQNEYTNGPSLELGGISIQHRWDAIFPLVVLPSHPKDWIKHGSTAKTPHRLKKIQCRVTALSVLTQNTNSLINLLPPNARNFSPQSKKVKPWWETA